MSRVIRIEFEPIVGDWGAQFGWVTAHLMAFFPGLTLNRMPVFRRADTGGITFGSPLVAGDLPASRYSCITFDTDRQRERFLTALDQALRAAHTELFVAGDAP
jgi:hypothetical protein